MNISDDERERFPIKNADEFVEFFQIHLKRARDDEKEPNLSFLSVLLGYLEFRLTLTKTADHQSSSTESDADPIVQPHEEGSKDNDSQPETDTTEQSDADDFPLLDYDIVDALYLKFSILVKGVVDKSSTENTTRSGYATKELLKKVSDILWNRLNPHYHKDKAHIQSLFSFLTGRQLDCFGLAFVVIAACQILKYSDVHLALSEDHAWAAHGDGSKELTEITWHGKGTEDKRGMSLKETNTEKSWMYLHDNGIVCDRLMEVAAMIVAINPAIDVHTDSKTLSEIQHRLLKMMLDLGALDRYPMGLSFLAELDNAPQLHERAVESVEKHYNGAHVFPYCSQGQSSFKRENYKKAIHCWSKAARVLSNYNYTREDEEIYKEIMEIAGELIPQALRNDPSICDDRNCFLDLIKFYDGVCLWEEDSSTPVLHSWWAKYFTHTLGRFSSNVRESFQSGEAERPNATHPTNQESNIESQTATVRKLVRHSLRNEELDLQPTVGDDANVTRRSNLGVKSFKMKGLEELLVGSKKFNAHAVSLQLTAQSQVHFAKRRSNAGEYTTEYSGRIKKPKKFFE